MLDPLLMPHLISALVWTVLGLAVFILGFVVIDWWTPYDLWKEIVEEKNQALAIIVAGFCVGLAIIISAAIRG